MSNRVSIRDIAAAAGVSHSTVSRALHERGRMSAATRARILELAQAMGYTPDARARSLVSGQTFTIGVVVTTIADPFVAAVVSGIEHAAHEAGYSVFLSSSHADPEREIAVVETFQQRRVDAVIVTASRIGSLYAAKLEDFQVPIVLINNQQEGEYLHSVAVDDVMGARLAVQHLIDLGHRRIAYIGSEARPVSSRRRLAGFRQALEETGITVEPEGIITPPAAEDLVVGREAFTRLNPFSPTAIFAYNDMTAIGAMLAARELGIDIPGQFSLVGFDDIEATRFLSPSLTTVRQPREMMGQQALEMTLALLNEQSVNDKLLPCELVVRASTAAPDR